MNLIAVCVPARDTVMMSFAFDMTTAVARHVAEFPGDTVMPLNCEGSMICSQRVSLVKESLKSGATHILFIDSDMRFPGDTISRLLAHGKPVVAANCAKRRIPTGPTAATYDRSMARKIDVYSLPESTGLEKVDSVGTGLMLIEADVFKSLPEPWFATPWISETKEFVGEDIYFCRALSRAGIPLYIDHDLSKEIGHLGILEFRHEHTWAQRPEPMVIEAVA